MRVLATTELPIATGADTVAIPIFDGEGVAHDVNGKALSDLLGSGEARTMFKSLAVTHAAGKRWLLVGLGRRSELDPERARVAAAVAYERAKELGTRILCWEAPHHAPGEVAAGLVEGTVLAAYGFDRHRSAAGAGEQPPGPPEELIVSAHDDLGQLVERARVGAEAANAARDLQNEPGNVMTPTRLGERARELAQAHAALEVTVEGRAQLLKRGMGAFAAVAQGSYEEPALITLVYEGPAARGPVLGFVGKAVTFDAGGISLKPGAKMSEMKFDMSGGAAVIEALGAIATLKLPVRIVAVVGASENLPSGRSVKPGDIVRAMTGTTIEVNNTDAEGRLVLADCLARAVELGAERIVDLATLTGAIITSLGNTYAGVMSNDDGWAASVIAAGARSGEILWRLPLHPEYAEKIKGRYADIDNAPEDRKAGSIVAAEFLHRFVGEVPWAHIDIAGSAWELGRAYAGNGASGYGVRLLVELAAAHAG